MNRNRWWSLSLLFLLVNALGLWRALFLWDAHLGRLDGGARLKSSPAAEQVVVGRAPLRWVWTAPVVADEAVGQIPPSAPVTFDPPQRGRFVWVSDRVLEFQPSEDWPAARRVRHELNTTLTNNLGRVMAFAHSGSLLGPELQLLSARVQRLDAQDQLQVSLVFNAPVSADAVRAHLDLHDATGNRLDASLRETPSPQELLLFCGVGAAAPLKLSLNPGLASLHGPDGAIRVAKVVSLSLPERFSLTGVETQQPTFGDGHVELSFSSPPDLRSVPPALEILPPVKASIGQGDWWRRQNVRISGDFVPGTKYTLRLGAGLKGINGQELGEATDIPVLLPQRDPGLRFAHGDSSILHAAGSRRVRVDTENEGQLSLQLRRVHDNNLLAFLSRQNRDLYWEREAPNQNLDKPIWTNTLSLNGSGPVDIDLSEALAVAGHGVYQLQVSGKNSEQQIERLFLVSDLGLLARRQGSDELLVWAVGLSDSAAVADAELQVWSSTRQLLGEGRSDAQGMARLKLRALDKEEEVFAVVARKQGRLGVLALVTESPFPGEDVGRAYLENGSEAYVFSDRGIYRPNETLRARAIVRGPGGLLPSAHPVQWTLRSAAGLKVWSARATLSDVGTALADIPLGNEWPNGNYNLTLSLPGDDAPAMGSTSIFIESFVPPQVVVEASTLGGGVFVGPQFDVDLQARLLYGAAAADHPAEAVVTISPETFRSSEHPDFVFSDVRKSSFSSISRPLGQGQTDAEGRGRFTVRVPDELDPPSALRAVVGVSVREFSGRAATAFVSRRVDLRPYYLGLRLRGENSGTIVVDVLALSPDGSVRDTSAELELQLDRVEWQSGYRRDDNGRHTWVSEEIAIQEAAQTLKLEKGRASLVLKGAADAQYRVSVKDAADKVSASQRVYTGSAGADPERGDRVNLVFDKETVSAGDAVTLRLRAPFAGRALITVEAERLLHSEVVELSGREQSIPLVVPETKHPNLWVRAVVLRPIPGGGAQPVLRADGATVLRMDVSKQQAELRLEAAAQLRPAANAKIILRGEPGAEVTLAGVDEGILLLTRFATPDPHRWFSALRRVLSRQWDMYDLLMPELGSVEQAGDPAMGGGSDVMMANRMNPIDAKRFKPLAWWSGAQRFPESGVLELQVPLPEFSGEIRWMAVQVSPTKLGFAEARSSVGRDVVTQQSLPLFLAPGDRAQWTLRVHNRGDKGSDVNITLKTTGPAEASLGGVQTLSLAPGEVKLLTGEVVANRDAGVATCVAEFSCNGETWSDEIEIAVRPVEAWTALAERHLLAPGATLSFPAREGWFAANAKRSLRVSAMPAMQASGAVEYLLRYPYGCVEQTTSAAFPGLVMPELAATSVRGAKEVVNDGIFALWGKQRSNGGFGYWGSNDEASAEGSFHALEFLLEAKKAGYTVDEQRLRAALDWTRGWLNRGRWRLDEQGRVDNRNLASAALVLAKAGELDAGWAQRLVERREDLFGGARIVAADALTEAGHRPLALDMLRGMTAVSDSVGWYSRTADTANLLRVLLKTDPTDGRIAALVESVLKSQQRSGRWGSTYENAAVVRALAAYARAFPGPAEAPSFQWNGGKLPQQLAMSDVGELTNLGKRPLYVEELQAGIPLQAPEMDNAFRVERRLLRADGSLVDGPVSSGEIVMLHLHLRGLPRAVDYAVIDQRLPAGLEPLPPARQANPRSVTGNEPPVTGLSPRHLEVRDDRILVFPNVLGSGEAHVLLLTRAVSPGSYVFPAAFVQDMYHEEFAARGEEGRIEVK